MFESTNDIAGLYAINVRQRLKDYFEAEGLWIAAKNRGEYGIGPAPVYTVDEAARKFTNTMNSLVLMELSQ